MSIQQGHFFSAPPEPAPAAKPGNASLLALTTQPGRPLSKAQKSFNRLVARVETLRKTLAGETGRMDKALAYYADFIHPRMQRSGALRKELVRSLAPFLEGYQLKGRAERRALRELLARQFDIIVREGGPLNDADLKRIFQTVQGETWERMQAKEVEVARAGMEAMMEDFGIDLDLSGLRADMTEEDAAREMARLEAQFREQWENNKPQDEGDRPKSKRQMKQEERMRQAEEARKRGIGTIYKQLAKALHPDLELDQTRREQKSALMQELTVAYRNNDLHTLLRLELQWLQREEGNLDRMTDEKLAIYNDILKDQIAELELEIDHLPYHPRYQALMATAGPFDPHFRADPSVRAAALDDVIADIETTLQSLREKRPIDVVRQIIAGWRAAAREERDAERTMRRVMQSMNGTPF